jgi:16S rRNA (guanine527-N7)-methyltransferase
VTSHEFGARLAKRLRSAPIQIAEIPPEAVQQLEAYYKLLARWNTTINLTSLPLDEWNDQTIDRLLIEPLQASRYVPESAIAWFDVGSGGGSPAIPLKILRPAAQLTMVESKSRKAAFLREAIRELRLPSAVVEAGRFEDLAARPGMRGVAQLVTIRAVKTDARVFEAAAMLLGPSGALFVFTTGASTAGLMDGFEVADTAQLSTESSSQLVLLRRV